MPQPRADPRPRRRLLPHWSGPLPRQGVRAVHSVHLLAAWYLGFSVAFGPSLVRWADVRFAHRFDAGPPQQPKPAKGTPARRSALWAEWHRVVLAAVIATVGLGGLSLVVDADQRGAVVSSVAPLWLVVGVWFLAGPLSEPRRRTA